MLPHIPYLIPLLLILGSALPCPLLADASRVRLGWCFPYNDCSGSPILIKADSKAKHKLITHAAYCKSFLAYPDEGIDVQACTSKECDVGCLYALREQCTPSPPTTPVFARYNCLRVKRSDEEDE